LYQSDIRIRIVKFVLDILEKLFFTGKLLKAMSALSQNVQINHSNFIIVDVGANRAQNWKLISKLFQVRKSVLIEPNKKLHPAINQTLKNHDFTLIDKCITNYNGFTEFFYSNFDSTSSIVKPNQDSKYYKIKKQILGRGYKIVTLKKQCSTLDTIMDDLKISFIDYLKIDVEGAELNVLEGATSFIKQSKIGIIQLEIHDNDMRISSSKEIVNFLQDNKYYLYKSVKHSFGNFSEQIYLSENNKNLLIHNSLKKV